MNIAGWLYQTARSKPGTAAVLRGADVLFDYDTLARRAQSLASFLESRGVGQGDRVAIFAKNCPEYLEALHAVWWIGATVVPINFKLHPREARWIIENSRAQVVLTTAGLLADKSDIPEGCHEINFGSHAYEAIVANKQDLAAPASVSEDSLAWVFYTSGTTGRPKGVMLTHRNLAAMTYAFALDVDHVSGHEHSIYAAPMSHGAGLYCFAYIRAGAPHVIPESGGFDPDEIIDLAGRLNNLCFFAAPTMVKRLITVAKARNYKGDGIRSVIYGGGPMYAADIDEALALFGPRFIQIYGQGESPMTITVLPRDIVADEMHPNWRQRRASVGFAQAPVEVAIWGGDLKPVSSGQVGEIVVKGPTVMKGYLDNPQATAETLVNGWLRTGDLGCIDADGFLTLTGRSKDVIISGGSNIYPREVEDVLLQHPGVHEVSVVGAHDPDWGEIVVAFIVPEPGQECRAPGLDEWCRREIAPFKKPKRYHLVESLPKNSYGKVLKTELRALLAGSPK